MLADEDAAPLRGALFDQLVKELRSEYAAAVTACAQRIHKALAEGRRKGRIRSVLDKYGMSSDPGIMQEQVRPHPPTPLPCLPSSPQLTPKLVQSLGLSRPLKPKPFAYRAGRVHGLTDRPPLMYLGM